MSDAETNPEINPFDEINTVEDLLAKMAELDSSLGSEKYSLDNPPMWLVLDFARGEAEYEGQEVPEWLVEGAIALCNKCGLHITSEGEACTDPNCELGDHLDRDGRITLELDAWSFLAIAKLLASASNMLQNVGPMGLMALGIDGMLPKPWFGIDPNDDEVPYPDQLTEAQVFGRVLMALAIAIRSELASPPGTVVN